MPSFDIVSEIDLQEVDNAVNQVKKEISTRYDFKGSKSSVEFDNTSLIKIIADDNMKLKAITDIINQKIAKRSISVKSLDYKEPEKGSGDSIKQEIHLKQGIKQDDAKKIIKEIKDMKIKKVQGQIQGEQVRVNGPKRDDLQAVIQHLKEKVSDIDLQFNNFRD